MEYAFIALVVLVILVHAFGNRSSIGWYPPPISNDSPPSPDETPDAPHLNNTDSRGDSSGDRHHDSQHYDTGPSTTDYGWSGCDSGGSDSGGGGDGGGGGGE